MNTEQDAYVPGMEHEGITVFMMGTVMVEYNRKPMPLMGLFVTAGNQGIIGLGSSYLGLMALFYIFPAFTNGIQGFFRGMGNMSITLLGTFVQTSLRVVFVYLLAPVMGMQGVAYACAVGWSVMLLVEIPYYFWFMRGK